MARVAGPRVQRGRRRRKPEAEAGRRWPKHWSSTFRVNSSREKTMNIRNFAVSLLTFLLLASIWGCGATRTREGTGEYVDDSVITTKVKSAIFNDSTLKVNEINVETFKGVVQLSGFVRSQADIDQAVKVARGVAGVKSVKNDMRIK